MAGAVLITLAGTTAVIASVAQGAQGPQGPTVAPGTAGQLYVTNAAATSGVWATMSGDASADTVTVGKLTVTGLQGRALSAAAPNAGNTLGWTGAAWAPSALNLAGGANYVSGNLPLSNLALGAAAQIPVMNAGATAPVWVSMSGDVTMTAAGVATVAASAKGITQLTGQVTAGPGSGSQVATITPGTAGQIFVSNATPNAAWTSLISVELVHGRLTAGGGGTDGSAVIGPSLGGGVNSSLWLLNNGVAATSGNYAVASDGSNVFINSTAALGQIVFGGNNTAYMQMNASSGVITMTGYNIITGGGGISTMTLATNKAGASLILQGDTATTILTLTTLASFATKVRLAAVAAPAAPPASFFDEYMDNADGALKVISPAGHITTIGAA